MASILFKVLRNCNSQFTCNYLKNKKLFLHLFFPFSILHQSLNTLNEKIIVIANVLPELQTVKIFVRKLSQHHCFRTGVGSQNVKVSQMLPNFHESALIKFFFSFWVKFIWKICPSELGEILRLFVNTLTADGKYPVQSCKNLQLPIQMQLSENWSTFSELFVLFLQSTSNFKHFEKNKIVIANVFPKL